MANLFWVYERGSTKRAVEKARLPLEGLPKPREQKLSVLRPGSISPLSFLFLTLVHSFSIAPGGAHRAGASSSPSTAAYGVWMAVL